MQLVIGNKNYSSWSMRAWVLMRQAGIPFEEIALRYDGFTPESRFKRLVAQHSPAGKVPVLIDEGVPGADGSDDRGEALAVWDSLAIAEYLAERHPELGLWPAGRRDRARARSVCAEMHAGFGALREHCPMNIEASLPEVGARLLRDEPAVAADLARVVALWSELLHAHGGPLLFGGFTIADAYFAPVCSRIRTYALPVPPRIEDYVDAVFALPAMQAWVAEAQAEHAFVGFNEPYRAPPPAAP